MTGLMLGRSEIAETAPSELLPSIRPSLVSVRVSLFWDMLECR